MRRDKRGVAASSLKSLCTGALLWTCRAVAQESPSGGDDLPTDDAAKATASAGQWFAVVAFLVVMLVLSLVWAKNHKEDLGLDTLEHAMIVTSWNVSAERLLAVRCVILAFMFLTFISMIDPVHNGVSGVGGAFFCKLSSCATASRSSASSARHSRSRRLVSPFAPMKLFDAGRGSACAQGSPTGATSCSPCTLPQLSRTV